MARIMIVDDSPTDVLNLKNMLVKAGHIVTEAASGEIAIGLIKTNKININIINQQAKEAKFSTLKFWPS